MKADAIAVLGCVVRESGRPSPPLARRVELGARLFALGVAPRVIVSGGRRWGDHVEATVMRDGLQAAGVPPAVIAMELCSLSTAENCLYVARWLEEHGLERVVVATCGWHLPRALAGFRRLGVEAAGPPPEWCNTPKPSTWLRSRERLCGWLDWGMMQRWR
jgi:uncharacterized SAM-binding protein YcdF (DUF218 family)